MHTVRRACTCTRRRALAAAVPPAAVPPLQLYAKRFPVTADLSRWEVQEEEPAVWLPGTLGSEGIPRHGCNQPHEHVDGPGCNPGCNPGRVGWPLLPCSHDCFQFVTTHGCTPKYPQYIFMHMHVHAHSYIGILAALSGQQRALESLPLPAFAPPDEVDEVDEVDEADEADEADAPGLYHASGCASGRASSLASGLNSHASGRVSPRTWSQGLPKAARSREISPKASTVASPRGSGRNSPSLVAWEDLEGGSRSRHDLETRKARAR